MRVLFHKVSDQQHGLEIVRDDGRRERIECETRSTLHHDLVHFAVEAEAGLDGGFWGCLAAGKTLADLNDRSDGAMGDMRPELAQIEQVVGALNDLGKGRTAAELVAGIARFSTALRQGGRRLFLLPLGVAAPPWLTVAVVDGARERMRRLDGHWRATPYGGAMELVWPARA